MRIVIMFQRHLLDDKLQLLYDSPMSRLGRKNFNTCKVKAVTSEVDPESPTLFGQAPMISTVRCPRTEDDGVNFGTSQSEYDFDKRYAQLLYHAAQYICDGCVYARMTPPDVAEVRVELANKDSERLEAVAHAAGLRATINDLG
jgi:hypothetical protein